MGQAETEQKLLELARLMRDVYRQYAGNVQYLEFFMVNGNIHIYNAYWDREKGTPINVDESEAQNAGD